MQEAKTHAMRANHIAHPAVLLRPGLLEVLRKSQLGLFDPHHVEYLRRNQSGTISRIAARGAQRQQQTAVKQGELDFTGASNRPARRTRTPKPTPPPAPVATYDGLMAQGEELYAKFRRAALGQIGSYDHLFYDEMLMHFSSDRDIEACEKASEAIMSPAIQAGAAKKMQQQWVTDILTLIGPESVPTFRRVEELPQGRRAHASRLWGTIVINKDTPRSTVYHEVAHHIEFSDPMLPVASKRFVNTKAAACGSTEPEKLSVIARAPYRDDEVALRDQFCDPYVGKVYIGATTEVISMGLQHFTNGPNLNILERRDPHHLKFMLGVLQHLKAKEAHAKQYPIRKRQSAADRQNNRAARRNA